MNFIYDWIIPLCVRPERYFYVFFGGTGGDNENKQWCVFGFFFYVQEGRNNLYETMVMRMQLIITTKKWFWFAFLFSLSLLFQLTLSAQFTMYNKKLFSHHRLLCFSLWWREHRAWFIETRCLCLWLIYWHLTRQFMTQLEMIFVKTSNFKASKYTFSMQRLTTENSSSRREMTILH